MTTDTLISLYKQQFEHTPSFIITAPGRVNLIGEHIDYNGLPVLPAAIPHTITAVAGRRQDNEIHVFNTRPDYPSDCFTLENEIPHSPGGHWLNYIKAGMQGVMEYLSDNPSGCNVLFSGTIPGSAGLSSSSALVVASALTLLAVNETEVNRLELAETMAKAERYVGTQGGGMDQAICLLGKSQHAVKIEFFPLRTTYVPFPESHRILVAHSMITASKTENALLKYNRGPIECRIATAIFQLHLSLPDSLERLGDVLKYAPGATKNNGWQRLVDEILPKDSYNLDDVSSLLCMKSDDVVSRYLTARSGVTFPTPTGGFRLRQRALYAFSENDRVLDSCIVLNNKDITKFGRLMNEAHQAADTLYGISTHEMNALCRIMRDAGAAGARLTGAGFGGCCIGLVHESMVQTVMEAVSSKYYKGYLVTTHPELQNITVDDLIMFSIAPSSGAQIIPV